MIFAAKNIKLSLNEVDILATQCSLDIANAIDPRYDAGQRHSRNYFANDGVGSTLTFSHFLTGDLDKIKTFISSQGELRGSDRRSNQGQIITGSFGGLIFTSGYLQSYSIEFSPNSPVVANSTVVFFDDLEGEFTQTEDHIPQEEVLNCKNISIINTSATEIGQINDFLSASYNYTSEINPVYQAGQTVPERIYFGKKSVTMGIRVDNPTGYLPYNGITAQFKINLTKHNSSTNVENFLCFGTLQSRAMQASVGNSVSHQLAIVSHNHTNETNVLGIVATERPIFEEGSPYNLE
ncbi:MAG TPA: hypothetical protein DCM10_07695 [Xanthomarina gelatinilytica]|nr:hypothetical protein [Xanthomarina gelatinilytica]